MANYPQQQLGTSWPFLMIPASGVEADFRGKPNFAHFVRPEDINSASL
jgi:hypothetical protein